ncbi:hypothetical protein EZJ43_08055 [Pedobacter changchengzhani]|uniref:Uncharacterized protein n=1 Tax=Pedobacter changchengzhani TaxID=2529274 RepID=A0A4R5MLH2_9SPHI|nr:hypothetical protein [Pedobacter changchengzhani]TDG36462.1 hypothetical protein EZJ43_08055 [Pedobacter changchengzhani]
MRIFFASLFILPISFCSAENSFSAGKETENFIGKLNNNIDVVFSLINNGGKLTGFYYYDKIGIEIKLIGETVNGKTVLYELNNQNKKQAKITGTLTKNGFDGKWESLSTKKALILTLKPTNKPIPALPKNFVGAYSFYEKPCKLDIVITKNDNGYFYNFDSTTRTLKGKVTFSRSLLENLVYINFNGIEWAEDDGDISNEPDKDEPNADLPTVIQGLLGENEIIIQNYGNAMNHYLKVGECDVKYIHLKKTGKKERIIN